MNTAEQPSEVSRSRVVGIAATEIKATLSDLTGSVERLAKACAVIEAAAEIVGRVQTRQGVDSIDRDLDALLSLHRIAAPHELLAAFDPLKELIALDTAAQSAERVTLADLLLMEVTCVMMRDVAIGMLTSLKQLEASPSAGAQAAGWKPCCASLVSATELVKRDHLSSRLQRINRVLEQAEPAELPVVHEPRWPAAIYTATWVIASLCALAIFAMAIWLLSSVILGRIDHA